MPGHAKTKEIFHVSLNVQKVSSLIIEICKDRFEVKWSSSKKIADMKVQFTAIKHLSFKIKNPRKECLMSRWDFQNPFPQNIYVCISYWYTKSRTWTCAQMNRMSRIYLQVILLEVMQNDALLSFQWYAWILVDSMLLESTEFSLY